MQDKYIYGAFSEKAYFYYVNILRFLNVPGVGWGKDPCSFDPHMTDMNILLKKKKQKHVK